MRIRTRFITAALAAALLLGIALTTYLHAQSSATTDVRIAARLLENGKVEFGLQQRGPDGWGERILPTKNKFPADAEVGRWLRSTPVTITAGVPVDTESTGAWEFEGVVSASRNGHYDLPGPNGRLRLVCGEASPWDHPIAIFRMNARPIDWDVRSISVAYRVEGGITVPAAEWGNLTVTDGSASAIVAYDAAGFAAWLAVNYARSPILHLTVRAAESPFEPYTMRFRATFDLTGLPAVLADLPCFGIGG